VRSLCFLHTLFVFSCPNLTVSGFLLSQFNSDEAEGKEAAPQVKAVTRSKLLMVSFVANIFSFLQLHILFVLSIAFFVLLFLIFCALFHAFSSPQKRLTPSFGLNSGNLSPKRSAGMPKLNFLAQLTGRANGLKSTGDGECLVPNPLSTIHIWWFNLSLSFSCFDSQIPDSLLLSQI